MTRSPHVLAIDQGTTSTRAILFDAEGRVRRTAQLELTQHYPQPGWVEHDPEEIWLSTVAVCRKAAASADGPIAAIGIANQRETTVLWERATGRPVHHAIVWQDRRTAELCARWRREGLAETVARRTGLVIDPYFSASKIRWLLDAVPGLRRSAEAGEIAFGTIDSFLLWRLCGGRNHVTDVTNAARTMLFDIGRLAWDDELLEAFGIPRAILPEVLDTGADFGMTAAGLFGAAIPVAAMAGDQQAALIGQGCFKLGMIKSTYGTGAFALLNIGGEPAISRHRLLTTIAYRLAGRTAYALEGSIFVAGAAVQWLRDRLGIVPTAAEATALAAQADPRQRLYLVPGFAGLGAPYWAPQARGALIGLTAECGPAEIARAALEAVGYQTRDLIAAMMADAGVEIETLRVDGGMTASGWTMQFLADILPAIVECPAGIEATAWGAAYAAGLTRGLYPDPETMAADWRPQRRFCPQMHASEREERYAGWRRAVAGVLAAAPSSIVEKAMTQADAWPSLPLTEWRETCATLHLWTQIVGKIRLAQAPLINHWWQVPLYVTSRGLTTSPIPHGARNFQIDFDFIDHRLVIRTSDGASEDLALRPIAVADFYGEVMQRLRALGLDIRIWTMPVEIPDPIPFEQDRQHGAYDPDYANRFWRVLGQADRVFTAFRAGFIGKASPVHFFWGSFDLAVTRFSGRRAPLHPGAPNVADRVTREAYSHEVSSCGFWPGGAGLEQPIFYSYAYAAPPGFKETPVRPQAACYSPEFGEFILPYDAVRETAAPDETLLDFLQSTYEAAADSAHWDRAALERAATLP